MEFFSSDSSDEDEEEVEKLPIENETEALHNATETDMSDDDNEDEVINDLEENGNDDQNDISQGVDEQMNVLENESDGIPSEQPPVARKQLTRRAICRKALGRLAANQEIRQIRKQSGEPAKHRQMGNTKSSRNRNIKSVYREAQKISEKFHVDFLIHHACSNKVRPYKDRKAYGEYAKMHKSSTLAKEHDDQFASNYSMQLAFQNKEEYKLNETELMKASGETSGVRLGKTIRTRNRKVRFIYNLAAKISAKFTVDFIIHHACPNDTHPSMDRRAFGCYAKSHHSSPIGTKYTDQFVRGYAIAFESKKQKGKNTSLPIGSTLTELVMGSKSIIDKVISEAGVLKKKSKEPVSTSRIDVSNEPASTRASQDLILNGTAQDGTPIVQSTAEEVGHGVTSVTSPSSTPVPSPVGMSVSAFYSWEDKFYCKVPRSNPESFLLITGCSPVNPPKGAKIISLAKAPRIISGKETSLTRSNRIDSEQYSAQTLVSRDSSSTCPSRDDSPSESHSANNLEINDFEIAAGAVGRSVTPVLTPPSTPVPSPARVKASALYLWEDKLYLKLPRSSPESFLLVKGCSPVNPPKGLKIFSLAKAPRIISAKETPSTQTIRHSTRNPALTSAIRDSSSTDPSRNGAQLASPGDFQLDINSVESTTADVSRHVTPVLTPPSPPVTSSVALNVSSFYFWEDKLYCKVPQSNPESFMLVMNCNPGNPPKGVTILSLAEAPRIVSGKIRVESAHKPASTPVSWNSNSTCPSRNDAQPASPGAIQLGITNLRGTAAAVYRTVAPVLTPPSTPVPMKRSVGLSFSALYLWEDNFYYKVPQSNPESFLLVKGFSTMNPPKGVKIISLQKAPLLKITVK